MLRSGIVPAAVTPMDPLGQPDLPSLARLLAYFDAAGCKGVVIAGTNGEGPSLSAPEKRDLFRACKPLVGQMQTMLGIATASLEEAVWLGRQAAKDSADAVLVMPPSYFRGVEESSIIAWFLAVMDRAEVPLVAYNFPKMTGISLSPDTIGALASHPNFAGIKDASGDLQALAPLRCVLNERHVLYAGDATPLATALEAGWSGTISGAANVIPHWMVRCFHDPANSAKMELTRSVVEELIRTPQPVTNKALLAELGVIETSTPRLPLKAAETPRKLLELLKSRLGMERGILGLPLG